MKLIEFCVKYPVSVLVGIALTLLFGLIALSRIPIQMTPTIDRPEIGIETSYPGAAPQEVEEEIIKRQEEKLSAVEGLREMTSTSYDGRGVITLKFDWGVNKDVARLDVAEKLDLVQDMPDDAEEPVIRAVNSDQESPIAWIAIETSRDINEVRIEAEDAIKPRLERIPGVGAVWMFGGQEREVHVILDYQALSARNISINQIRDALLRENRNIKGGNLDEGKKRFLVRTIGQFTDLEQIKQVIIAQDRGMPVYLGDVAEVKFGYKKKEQDIRQFGTPTIGFGVLRKTGANTIEVMQELKKELAYLNEQVYKDKDIFLRQLYDETDYIYDAVGLVTSNLYYGGALTVAVLLLFLRNGASTFIISFAIPISIIATFIFLNILGRSLNIISLAGLAFAIGMVVDNSIVVLENIFRHRQMGKDRFRAAYDGAVEVWGAILASTLTTMAVFIPIIFVQEEAGQLFRDIAIAISVAVALSLIVSLTVIPMLSSRLLQLRPPKRRPAWQQKWIGILALDWVGTGFSGGLMRLLTWLMRGVGRRLALAALIVFLSIWLSYHFAPPIDYLPKGNRNLILAIIKTPPGFNLNQIETIIRELEQRFTALNKLERLFAVVRTDTPLMGAIVRKEFSDIRGMEQVIQEMRKASFGVPGTTGVFITQSPLFRRRGSFIGGINVEIDIKGDSLEKIQEIAEHIEGQVRGISGVNFVNSSFELGQPELQVHLDRDKAADLGLSVSQIGYIVETLVAGTQAGSFREQGKEIDLTLVGAQQEFQRTQDLNNIIFFTPAGQIVRLADIATVQEEVGPTKIDHIDRSRSIKLTVNIRDEIPLEAAIDTIDAQVVDQVRQELPLGYSINISGQAKDLEVTWNVLKWSFLLAAVIIYLLMCSLFESFVNPLVVMFSVPLAASGGILAVKLMNFFEPSVKMDVITMLGFIILAGIVVNNAILIIHQTLNNMEMGLIPKEALLESCRTRIRPIFMTSTTTVFGMLPLVISSGAGSELYRGLGAAVLGGLSVSTIFTLLLVPTIFSLWLDLREHLPQLFFRKSQTKPNGLDGHHAPLGSPELSGVTGDREVPTSPETHKS